MGTSVELKVGNYAEIRTKLVEKGAKNEEFLDKVLEQFGFKNGESYMLLNNEFWEEYNSYYSVSEFIDKYYGISDSFDVFLYSMKEANSGRNLYDVADALGVELPEHEDYE